MKAFSAVSVPIHFLSVLFNGQKVSSLFLHFFPRSLLSPRLTTTTTTTTIAATRPSRSCLVSSLTQSLCSLLVFLPKEMEMEMEMRLCVYVLCICAQWCSVCVVSVYLYVPHIGKGSAWRAGDAVGDARADCEREREREKRVVSEDMKSLARSRSGDQPFLAQSSDWDDQERCCCERENVSGTGVCMG